MNIIGIDPGLTGALALVNHKGYLLAVEDMPNDGNGRVSIPLACSVLRDWGENVPIDAAVVEDVHSMPKQGVSTTFKFGRAAGVAECLPLLFGLPVHLIGPSEWKKAHRLTGKGKDAARQHAIRLWPDHAGDWFRYKAKGQARADAALLALAWMEASWRTSNAPA